MSVDEEEAAVRAFLQGVVLRALKARQSGEVPDLPDLTELEVWPLMKAAAALGYNIDISVRSGIGKVTAEWMETDE